MNAKSDSSSVLDVAVERTLLPLLLHSVAVKCAPAHNGGHKMGQFADFFTEKGQEINFFISMHFTVTRGKQGAWLKRIRRNLDRRRTNKNRISVMSLWTKGNHRNCINKHLTLFFVIIGPSTGSKDFSNSEKICRAYQRIKSKHLL